MGNESSSPASAPSAALPVRRGADGKIEGLTLSPGDRRRLPNNACRGDRPLLFGILQAAHRVRSVCVLFGERGQVVAQVGPGSLLSLPGVSLDYLNGCEVFAVRPGELPECVQRVVFAGLIEEEGGGAVPSGAGNVAAEAFLALSSSSSGGQAAAGGASCTTPSCAPETELAGRSAELNVLAKMSMLLSSNQHQAHFSLRTFGGDPSSSWQLEATGAPVVLVGGAISSRAFGGAYESVEVLPVPDLGPAQPALQSSGSSQVRQLERQLQEEQRKNQRLARNNTEALKWNTSFVEKVETKQYQLEVWRRQALIWAKGWDTETVMAMLDAGGWPLTTGDSAMSLVELHLQLGSKLSKELTDPRGHPLEVWASDAHGYKCDVCKTKYPVGSIFYSCRATGYDECSDCYFKRLQKLMFDKLDKNRDGVISQAEFQAAMESPLEAPPVAPPEEPARSARSEATTTARSGRPPQVAALDLSSVGRPVDQPKKKTANKQPSREAEPSDAGTWESDNNNNSNNNNNNNSARLAQQVKQVDDDIREITVDLERPFGVLFDNSLTVKAVKENSQGEKLQIHVGYKVVSANGGALQSIAGLESQVNALRSVGQKSLVIQFSTKLGASRLATAGKPNTAPSGGEVDLDHASRSQYATLRATPQVHSIDPLTPGGTPVTTPRNGVQDADEVIECTLDVSRPWGLLIGDDLHVQDVQERSQSEEQGIGQGWKVLKLNGQPVRSIHELKDSMAKLKADRKVKAIRLSFIPSEEESDEEEEEQDGDTPRNR